MTALSVTTVSVTVRLVIKVSATNVSVTIIIIADSRNGDTFVSYKGVWQQPLFVQQYNSNSKCKNKDVGHV